MEKPVIRKLKNGLTIGFVPHRGVRSVTLQLRGFAGSNYEKNDEIGAAHLIEHLSLESPLKNKILFNGGKIYGVTSRDDVLYMVKVLKKDFPLAVEFLYNVFTNSEFNPIAFESQKRVAEEETRRFINMPEKLIVRVSNRILYPKQRISEFNTGGVVNIKKLSMPALKRFKNRTYSPQNFALVASGDLNSSEFYNLCRSYFSVLKSGEIKKRLVIKKNKGLKIQNLINKYFSQSHFRVDYYGFNSDSSEKFSAIVLAKILNNYLNQEIKLKRGYAYNVGCDSFSSFNYGVFSFYFAVGSENIDKTLEIIFSLRKNVKNILTKDIVSAAKNQIVSDIEFALEKTSLRADYFSNLILQEPKNKRFFKESNQVIKVSIKDLLITSNKIFKQEPKITILSSTPLQNKVRKILKSASNSV